MTGKWLDLAAESVSSWLDELVASGGAPGAVAIVGTVDQTRVLTHGVIAPGLVDLPPLETVLFDIASLTKIVATWVGVGQAVAAGDLDLDAPVGEYFGEESLPGSVVTTRQLLSHTSGLMAATRFDRYVGSGRDLVELILSEPLDTPPGISYRYINRGFVLLGLLLERLYKRPLDQLMSERVWQPWSMNDTSFGPLTASCSVAPTETRLAGTRPVWGVVHDENAAQMGGVAGHAGVFTTARDLATFCRRVITDDWGDTGFARYVEQSVQVHAGAGEHRGLAWLLSDDGRTMYHHGFTGSSVFVFKEKSAYVTVLSNAVYNSRDRRGLAGLRHNIRGLAER
ncbi:serine hydrolase domain-containing protein [Nonomuraea sp. NPDC050227]|uniref:serine hydrolase domain-containing protein n=1 Tax=Nonomuraea sp. NPDC050227 TaxID=3364360 RepID=UPI0037954A7F